MGDVRWRGGREGEMAQAGCRSRVGERRVGRGEGRREPACGHPRTQLPTWPKGDREQVYLVRALSSLSLAADGRIERSSYTACTYVVAKPGYAVLPYTTAFFSPAPSVRDPNSVHMRPVLVLHDAVLVDARRVRLLRGLRHRRRLLVVFFHQLLRLLRGAGANVSISICTTIAPPPQRRPEPHAPS